MSFINSKSSPEAIRANFDSQVERFSNLETGQTTAIDSPLCMELVARSAALLNPLAYNPRAIAPPIFPAPIIAIFIVFLFLIFFFILVCEVTYFV